MNEWFFILLTAALVILGISVFFLRREIRDFKESKEDNLGLNLIKQDLQAIQEEIRKSGEKHIETIQVQLRESSKVVKDVTSELEKLHSDHQHVRDVKTQLEKLSDVLVNPKRRGILGEYLLETLLGNIFQPHQYKCQYSFKDGETVDAVIFVKDKIIPIDSKFSLENYNKILEEKDAGKREKLEKLFKQDLKNRIDETSKYIRPQEKTTDFAFMFIPSEGIYYDLLINRIGAIKSNTYDLVEYAFKEKHVILVSPTSFYAYLQTVLQGLKALQIEQSAKQIRDRVEVLQRHLLNYDIFLQKLGNNLNATVNTYNRSYKEFKKIDKDIAKITEGEQKIKPLELEKPEQNQ